MASSEVLELESQIARLHEALDAGESSGEPEAFDFDTFLASKKA
ncbi:type II toxin-antitoxin system ParD family antitoxin [Microbacterium lacticum]